MKVPDFVTQWLDGRLAVFGAALGESFATKLEQTAVDLEGKMIAQAEAALTGWASRAEIMAVNLVADLLTKLPAQIVQQADTIAKALATELTQNFHLPFNQK